MDDLRFTVPDKNEQLPIVTVIYKEGNPETYQGIEITLPDGELHKLNTGEFIRDYMCAMRKYEPFHKSSSVDTYIRESGIGWWN